MDSLTVKTVAVFAIIFGCFAVLYPKIFHPILSNMFGATPARHMDDDMFRSPRPGSIHKTGKGGKHRNGPGDDFPPHMRGGPHPGMRAAAEMKKQMAPPGGNSGRGMMGIVLPMYAVGIVIYLIYTLSKVFGGKKKGDDDYLTSHFKEETKKKKRHFSDEDINTEDQAHQYRKVKQSQKNLEKLLIKADKDDLSECDMRDLRHRLLDTERQMTRILQAMQDVQEKVVDLSSGLSDSDDSEGSVGEQMDKLERLVQKRHHPKTTVNAKQEEQKPAAAEKVADSSPDVGEGEKIADSSPDGGDGEKVAGSSPDMESYEIVNGKQESDKCSIPDGTPVIETVGLMEITSPNEDDSCCDVAACRSRVTTESDHGSGDIELDAAGGSAGTEEIIPDYEAGESGDHSELRKRTSAMTGDERK